MSIPEKYIIATVHLGNDPFMYDEEGSPPPEKINHVATGYLKKLLEHGWVQFTWTKVTNGAESSMIATRNKHLYEYTFKGKPKTNKRGLIRMVAFMRASAGGKPVWRSAYAQTVSRVEVRNKNQGRGRDGRNMRVNVNSGTRETIPWDYEMGKPGK